MSPADWIKILSLVVDVIKTAIPFGTMFGVFWYFQKEIKELIKKGGLKVAAPGFSLETVQKQQERLGPKEKKEIESLNLELETTKKAEQRLRELQEYTTREKDTFFLGYHLEKTYRLIFPSQMVILNILKIHNEVIDPLARALFQRTIWAQQFNVTYEQFMGFLVQSGLVNYDGTNTKFTLTPLGKTFLDYLSNNNIPLKLPANDMVEIPANN